MIGHWSFDEGSGTILHDSSGGGNNGTINGATWSTAGRFGNCLYFDGVSANVMIPDGSWDTNAPKTFVFWYKVDTTPQGMVINHDMTGANTGSFAFSDNGSMRFCGYDGNMQDTGYCAPDYGAGVWTMIAASITPTTLKVYANGEPMVAPEAINGWPIISGPLSIGFRSYYPYAGGDNYFKGWIDEFSIYDRALTAAEVAALYRARPPPRR